MNAPATPAQLTQAIWKWRPELIQPARANQSAEGVNHSPLIQSGRLAMVSGDDPA